jgi:hypothetical protein
VIDFHGEACGIFLCLKACGVIVDLEVNGRRKWHVFVIIIQRLQPEQSWEKLGIVCWFHVEFDGIVCVGTVNNIVYSVDHHYARLFKLAALEQLATILIEGFYCCDFLRIADQPPLKFSGI